MIKLSYTTIFFDVRRCWSIEFARSRYLLGDLFWVTADFFAESCADVGKRASPERVIMNNPINPVTHRQIWY